MIYVGERMKNKKFLTYIGVVILCLYIGIQNVLADENLVCTYSDTRNSDYKTYPDYKTTIHYSVGTINGAMDPDKVGLAKYSLKISDGFSSYFFDTWTEEQKNYNKCVPVVYACYETTPTVQYEYTIYIDSASAIDEGRDSNKCYWANLKSSSGGEQSNSNSDDNQDDESDSNDLSNNPDTYCPTYEPYLSEIKKGYTAYDSCGDNSSCKIKKLNTINDNTNQLKSFCTSIISKSNTDDPCVNRCLQLNKEMLDLKKAHGMGNKLDKNCNLLSTKLIGYIYNILKWIKYIIPALVIILNIMDLIKAIASSNEDSMKKAQGRFVKRLIVAALVFLLPLIINFLLKTFGLYHSGCDL